MKTNVIYVGAIFSILLLTGQGCLFNNPPQTETVDQMIQEDAMDDDVMMKDDEGQMMDDQNAMTEDGEETSMQTGSYESYAPEKLARAEEGNVVLFFRASWCPTCSALDKDLRAHVSDIPENVTILDVDYDTETALKKKYGVTYQHTLVQVDAQGNQINKWSGGNTLTSVLGNIK